MSFYIAPLFFVCLCPSPIPLSNTNQVKYLRAEPSAQELIKNESKGVRWQMPQCGNEATFKNPRESPRRNEIHGAHGEIKD